MTTHLDIVVPSEHRATLGDMNSIVCFKACVRGLEEALGTRAALVSLRAAGRARGRALVDELGLAGSVEAVEDAAGPLRAALGPEGTRLCIVESIEKVDDETYRVHLSETICSCLEEQGSSTELSFTFGAVQGALERLLGEKVQGRQVGSVLRGQQHDTVELRIFR